MAEAPILSNPPDWNSFTLDLFCPRCDYNVRMLTGSRCPECGLNLDWPRIIAASKKRVENPLFEYRWRERPVRSFFVTIRFCLRPWQLWKWLSIADAPQTTGLSLFALLLCLLYMTTIVGAHVAGSAISMMTFGRPAAAWRSLQYTLPFVVAQAGVECLVHVSIALMAWLFLHVFQQTISKHRIKRAQLWRLVIFSYAPVLLVKLLSALPIISLYSSYRLRWFPTIPVNMAIDGIALGIVVVSLGLGLTRYLQVQRGGEIAICLLAMTFLTCFTVIVLVSIAAKTWDNTVAQPVFSAWPGLQYSVGWLLDL